MAGSQNSFMKQQKERVKKKKKEDKEKRKQERKDNSSGGDLESMLAYVDEFGNLSSTPPLPPKPTPSSDSEGKEKTQIKKQ